MSLENRLAEIEKKISAERFFVWRRKAEILTPENSIKTV